jgi:hypothetical protein
MNLEKFKKIPRNDVLLYLHQNKHYDISVKFKDIYDRINKPTFIFCCIIDDLIRLKFIECKNYVSQINNRNSIFPIGFDNVEITLTELGSEYTEKRILGYNLECFDKNNSLDTIHIPNMSAHIDFFFNLEYVDFCKKYNNQVIDPIYSYYIFNGINYKSNNEKKIFISYSWDNEINNEHKEWVDKIALDLSKEFNIEYDKFLKYGMSPNQYMKHNILSSDYVIIIFSPNYKTKVNSEIQTGASTEFSIIKEDLFRKMSHGKYIPILKVGSKNDSIPEMMQDSIYFDFTKVNQYQERIKELIEHLTKN